MSKTKIRIYGITLATLLTGVLASCASEQDIPTPDQGDGDGPMMTFNGMRSAEEAPTRSGTPFQDTYKRFAVWGWKTIAGGATQEVLSHEDYTPYEVVYDRDNGWHYDIFTTVGETTYRQWLKYWDLSTTKYDFVAFAPFRVPDTDAGETTQGKIGFDRDTHTFAINNMRGNVPYGSLDHVGWLRAHTRRDMNAAAPKDYDVMVSTTDPISDASLTQTSEVPLVFHYLQPIIEIHAYTTCGEDISASDITVDLSDDKGYRPRTIHTLGDYSIDSDGNDVWNYGNDNITSSLVNIHTPTDIKYIAPEDLPNRREKSTLLAELYEFPEDVSDFFAKIYLMIDEKEYRGLQPMEEGWGEVKRYIYYIIINPDDSADEYIVMDVDVESIPWEKGGDIETGDPLNNW